MGQPAARAGDLTSHGSPLGPSGGSTNVFIGGKPAWRVGVDMHNCPISPSPTHIGGFVVSGSSSVFINNAQAVRMNDKVMESGGGLNSITSGEMSVQIG